MNKAPKKRKAFMVAFSKVVRTIPALFETKEKKEFKRWKNFLTN